MILTCESMCLLKEFQLTSVARPESMGLVCASVYVLSLVLFIPFAFSSPIRAHANGHGTSIQEGITVAEFPHYQVIFQAFHQICGY